MLPCTLNMRPCTTFQAGLPLPFHSTKSNFSEISLVQCNLQGVIQQCSYQLQLYNISLKQFHLMCIFSQSILAILPTDGQLLVKLTWYDGSEVTFDVLFSSMDLWHSCCCSACCLANAWRCRVRRGGFRTRDCPLPDNIRLKTNAKHGTNGDLLLITNSVSIGH